MPVDFRKKGFPEVNFGPRTSGPEVHPCLGIQSARGRVCSACPVGCLGTLAGGQRRRTDQIGSDASTCASSARDQRSARAGRSAGANSDPHEHL